MKLSTQPLQRSIAVALLLSSLTLGCGRSSDKPSVVADVAESAPQPPVKLGLSINEPKAFQGYTLIAPVKARRTFLIDMQGKVVHTWQSDCTPALSAYLLENGHLLRTGALPTVTPADGPGAGGRVQEFTWDGELVWDYKFTRPKQTPHHDVTRLPNGNVLLIVEERKTIQQALAAGCRADLLQDKHLSADYLIEIKPTGKTTGEVVWEWHLWDHLVQENNPAKAHYGKLAEHPELLDINHYNGTLSSIASAPGGMDKLRSIGYVGGAPGPQPPWLTPNWSHLNSVAYNAEFDQIVVTSFAFSEFWIIDHSTITAEASRHSGGRSGKGGDILYRWGNPSAYGINVGAPQQLFAAHNADWVPRGLPGAGHMLVFNNGKDRPDGNYSSVDELELPVGPDGKYAHQPGAAYAPKQPLWSFSAPNKDDFYSMLISGAQRLPNGNTLLCSGCNGTLLEVTPEKEVVWKYVNPTPGGFVPSKMYPAGSQGFGPPGGGSLFRAYRYGPDYPGLAGKELKPGKTIEEIFADEPRRR